MNAPQLPKLEQFFSQFDPPHLYQKGEILLRADDNPSGVFYLVKGFVRLYSISPEGQEITFNIFKPASFFSMIWAIGDSENSYFFEALTEVEVWRAPRNKFLEFIKKEPVVLFNLTRRILIGLDGLITTMESLLFGNAKQKVALVVLILAKRFGQKKNNGDVAIELPLTHRLIASLAGLTRETTSLEMEKLEKTKTIAYGRHLLTIKNIKNLEKDLLIFKEKKSSPEAL